jgi:long-chain acyl-CoA synthetase
MEKIYMDNSWDFLDQYRGTFFNGEWPTITEQFSISAHEYPDGICFTSYSPEEIHFTYHETQQIIEKTADYLIESGLEKGECVALTGKNTPYWALAYLAISRAGGVIVPIDYQLDNDTMQRFIRLTEAKFIFVDKEKYGQLTGESTVRISLSPDCEHFILDLKAHHRKKPEVTEDDLAAVLFTSGTTGNEKGVMLTHRNLISDVYQACHPMFLGATQEDVWYALLPLHHSYCMTAVFLESIKFGSELVFAPRLAVPQIMKDLKQGGITIFMGIPLLFNKILQGMMKQVRAKGLVIHLYVGLMMRISGLIKRTTGKNPGKKIFASLLKKANLDNLRLLICGGGPLAPETFQRYNELGLDFVQGYGLTETSPILTLNPVHHFKVDSVGKVFPLIDMKILDPDPNGIGEIIVKGPTITQGYYKNREATEELFTSDGYLKTGDLGYLDRENYLYLTGRKKSLIVTEGGKNVFPEEIEDHFQLDAQIEQIMVRGYIANKETKSEGIEAVIYPNVEYFSAEGVYNKEKVADELASLVLARNRELLPYKRIQRIRVLDEPLEMTTTQKIKRPLVEQLIGKADPGILHKVP